MAVMAVLSRRTAHRAPARRGWLPAEPGPDALLYALAIMIWTYVWRVQDLFPILAALRLHLLATVVAAGLFMLDSRPTRRLRRLRTPILVCALALGAVAILGIPFSLWPQRSAVAFMTELAPNLLLMVLLAASIRGMRDLQWIAMVTLLGACVFSLVASLTAGHGPQGRPDDLAYYDANDLALVLLCTIPIAIFFIVRGGRWYRMLGVASGVLLLSTLVGSGSRGGFLGFVAVLLYILLGYRAIPRRLRVLTVLGGAVLFSLVASDAYWERIRTLTEPAKDYNWSGQSREGRLEVWRRGLGYMAAHPVLGVGLRNFPLAEGMLSTESRARAARGLGFKWSVAHNSFLEIGVELGVTGLAFFVAMLAGVLRALGRIRSERPLDDPATRRNVALACTMYASLIGFIVAGSFVSAAYFSYLYVLLALALGFVKVHRSDRLRPQWPPGWESLFDAMARTAAPAGPPARARYHRTGRYNRLALPTLPDGAGRS